MERKAQRELNDEISRIQERASEEPVLEGDGVVVANDAEEAAFLRGE